LESSVLTRLLLIRHARSTWNAERRIQGCADPPLDERGREQAHRLVGRLRRCRPTALYTSPLQRALETADIIGRALDVPVIVEERLKEHDIGDVSGLTWEQVLEQYPDIARIARRWVEMPDDATFPGEEDVASFQARVVAAFEEILARHFPSDVAMPMAQRAEGTVGVVSHGGTLGAYLSHVIGLSSRVSPFRFANASLSIVEMNPVRPRIVLLNDTCHLGDKNDRGEQSPAAAHRTG
jgi:broad specificity phosphatase PhoE